MKRQRLHGDRAADLYRTALIVLAKERFALRSQDAAPVFAVGAKQIEKILRRPEARALRKRIKAAQGISDAKIIDDWIGDFRPTDHAGEPSPF